MAKVITATYEQGVIKPKKPLKLAEKQEIKVVILTPDLFEEAKKAVFDFDIEDYISEQEVHQWK